MRHLYDIHMQKMRNGMTDYECTLLVGIPNAPSVYSLNNRPDLAKQRQKKVIRMYGRGRLHNRRRWKRNIRRGVSEYEINIYRSSS